MSFSTYDELVRAALLQHSNRLAMALSEADREIKDLKDEIENWKSECRAKDFQVKANRKTLTEYGFAVDSMRKDKERLNEIIKFRERDIDDLIRTNNEKDSTISNLKGIEKIVNPETGEAHPHEDAGQVG